MSESKPYSRMSRTELEAEADRIGIEGAAQTPTVKELRDLVAAYAEMRPNTGADAQHRAQNDDEEPSDLFDQSSDANASGFEPGGAGDTANSEGPARDGNSPPAGPELANIPNGCIAIFGLGPEDCCAFFEQDERHPDGEVFITGGTFAIAYPTPALLRRIGRTITLVELATPNQNHPHR